MNTATKIFLNLGVAAVTLVSGLGCATAMISMAPSAVNDEPPEPVFAVQVLDVQTTDVAAIVTTTGLVEAELQVGLTPEVAGRVVHTSDSLRPGGRFNKGDALLQLDTRDYKTAVVAERARVSQAQLNLALERERVETARREWELVGQDGEPGPLVLRGPQLALAQANADSAEASLRRAELNVQRATLRAPFNAVVVQENVDVGQVVGPGAPIVTLLGTDAVRIATVVPVDQLSALQIPAALGQVGSSATVRQALGGDRSVVRAGVVSGMAGQLDAATRTARVYVRVQHPMDGDGLPLLAGAFVDVDIVGRTVSGVTPVPRIAVHNGNVVWVAKDDRMVRREVQIAWRAGDEVFVSDGLEPGDKVVVSALSNPIEGMKLSTSVATASTEQE